MDWESRALVEADISDFGNYLSGLTDGIGTTANGTAVNLGGDVDSYRQFNFSGTGQFLFDFGGGATIFSSGENFAIHTDSSGRGFTRNSSAEITTLDGSLGAVDMRSATGLTLQDYRAGASATGWEYGGDFTVNWTSDPSFDNFLATKKYVDDNNPSGSFQLFTDNASAGTYFLMPDVTSLPTPPNNSSYAVKIPIKAPASGTQNRSVISFSPSEAQNEFVSSVSEVFFGNTIVSQIDADSSKIEFWMPENESNLLSTSPYFILENSAVSGEKRIISSLTELQFSGFTINNTQITSGIVGTPLAISAQGGVSIEGLIYPSADGGGGCHRARGSAHGFRGPRQPVPASLRAGAPLSLVCSQRWQHPGALRTGSRPRSGEGAAYGPYAEWPERAAGRRHGLADLRGAHQRRRRRFRGTVRCSGCHVRLRAGPLFRPGLRCVAGRPGNALDAHEVSRHVHP